MGDESTDTAAARLQHLTTYFREHPVTGPSERHAATVTPGAPLSLATLDHVRACVDEVVQHTHAANPTAGPAPSRAEAVYDWCRQHTQHTDDTVQLRGQIIEYRQYLEHAIRAGDVKVVRPLRCPECQTFGLMWIREMRTVVSRTFTLARLATHHVTSRKNLRQACAT
jgi:hypothetical protein